MAIQTDGNLQRMQEEALRRAREMHARATPVPPPPPVPKEELPRPVPSAPAEVPAPPRFGGLETLLKDKDRTVILALLLILGSESEKNNSDLLMALLFLLM